MPLDLSFNEPRTRASLVFSHPTHNVITLELVQQMRAALEDLSRLRTLKLVTLEGAGDDFSFGADIAEHLPEAIAGFVFDTAARLGVDPAGIVVVALVALASVMDDKFRLQPRRFDDSWTEAPRIWGAIVGDPSVLKSPIISVCTRPIDHLEADARDHHAEDAIRPHTSLSLIDDRYAGPPFSRDAQRSEPSLAQAIPPQPHTPSPSQNKKSGTINRSFRSISSQQ